MTETVAYAYYPGCSMHATGKAYELSTRAVCEALGVELREIEDWNCCGATAYLSTDDTASIAVAARNLALAEAMGLPLVTPCSACYVTLHKIDRYMREYPQMRKSAEHALGAAGLEYRGTVPVRHLMFALIEDVGFERMSALVQRRDFGMRVAPYYGCQIVRPLTDVDSPDAPVLMDRLFEALGVDVTPYSLKTKCCGGALIGFSEREALELVEPLLRCAVENDATCIATACPLCQVNLDAYQRKVNATFGSSFNLPIMFFTQVMGLAFGIDERRLGLDLGIADFRRAMMKRAD